MPNPDTAVGSCFPEKDGRGSGAAGAEILFDRINYQVQRRVDIPSKGPPGRQQYKTLVLLLFYHLLIAVKTCV